MEWNIITDSSCDLLDLKIQSEHISFSTIPFTISVGNRDFIDDTNLNVDEMITAMNKCKEASRTACPSPYAWYEQFEKAENSFAVTISSKLSGSYNSALAARNMISEKYPDKKIAVLDSRSAGSEIVLIIEKLYSLIETGQDFESIVKTLEEYIQNTHIVFALSSFNNLIKNGRMSKLAGLIAGRLGFWGIGIGTEHGTISIKKKVRGSQKALNAILDDIKERGQNVKKVVISHCQNIEFAEELKSAIENMWNTVEVKIIPARGLCSYYAEKGGLIVGF